MYTLLYHSLSERVMAAAPSSSSSSSSPSLVLEVGPGATPEQVAAAVASLPGLSEAGKAQLIDEVSRAVQGEEQPQEEGHGKKKSGEEEELEAEAPPATAAASSSSLSAVVDPSAEAPLAAAAEGGEHEETPFRLPGELPPGREQEEAEEVMRLLFQHLQTAEGREEFTRLVAKLDAEDAAKEAAAAAEAGGEEGGGGGGERGGVVG